MRREMEEHNDLVFLPVTEGYRMNSRKAWLTADVFFCTMRRACSSWSGLRSGRRPNSC